VGRDYDGKGEAALTPPGATLMVLGMTTSARRREDFRQY
jgi:hypothetical protein